MIKWVRKVVNTANKSTARKPDGKSASGKFRRTERISKTAG